MTLDDINTDRGCLQYMFLAETLMPQGAGYNYADAKRSFNAMKATIYNRIAHPGWFPPGGATAIDFITDTRQFPEFSKDDGGNVVLANPSLRNITDALGIANDSTNRLQANYVQHIQAAKDISGVPAPIIDEFADLRNIGGTAVIGGTYAFNKGAALGGRFIKIPGNGVIMGVQYWTLTP